MDKRLLDILCCPTTRQPLRMLTRTELDRLNQAAANGMLTHADGSIWKDSVPAALITRDGSLIYRIEDDIPVMLADLAVAVASVPGFATASN